ncbi:hypothetical protein VTL71DRAFT_7412 [Oculimacula yallundae]|uniref:Uncharacterized protein n=1 Tax=Oculimacula yallundae TaxID=86028 RepID=A0ABR4BU20_9HELO
MGTVFSLPLFDITTSLLGNGPAPKRKQMQISGAGKRAYSIDHSIMVARGLGCMCNGDDTDEVIELYLCLFPIKIFQRPEKAYARPCHISTILIWLKLTFAQGFNTRVVKVWSLSPTINPSIPRLWLCLALSQSPQCTNWRAPVELEDLQLLSRLVYLG